MTESRCRSYRFLLQPTVRQRVALDGLLRRQCELYNAALEERRGAWEWERRSISYVDQSRTLTGLRSIRPDVLDQGVIVCRGTLKRLDRAFGAFYRRCKPDREESGMTHSPCSVRALGGSEYTKTED